jgi:hypothetical protein
LPHAEHAVQVMKARLGPLGRGIRWAQVRPHMTALSHAQLVKAAETAAKHVILRGEELPRSRT